MKIDKSCGCLIDDLLDDNRLCGSSPEDMKVMVDPDPERISLDFYQKKFTDGLPVIPPTQARVKKFYHYSSREPDDVIAVLPPRMGKATVEKVAVNAVMAGCLPGMMPLLEACIEGMSREEFNLAGINATTHPVAVGVIVNGPARDELGFNSADGCLGPGNLANATLGRAIRLCLINIAGAIPGVGDHATMGSPAKYAFCLAENESMSPWEPLHVERGFDACESTVTVLGMEAPHNVNDHRSRTPEDLLDTVVHTASTAGCNNSHVPGELLVIMSPEHAETVASHGWSREDVRNYIHERALVPAPLGDRGGRKLDYSLVVDDMVPVTGSPDDVVLVVAGGAGRHTMIAHGFGGSSESQTVPVELKKWINPSP
ncbi:hypothetical protein [Methanothermobacter wolfeii]|uniref:hypothetical protein n=1 Tax=Methanothermobacter wolfeii TaxID=145261 RepID=UPI0024B329C1|nr:hypothetical protein [Methanothermobacter wolfeii]MDI6701839.1 hypothetical protein [Methanothermobacter wolfeii]MDI6841284.1 hypothetical protein [Methanothermobacter wolfeii]